MFVRHDWQIAFCHHCGQSLLVHRVLNNNKPAKNMKTKQNNQLLMKRTRPCSWLRRGMAAGVAALACVSIANAHPYAVYR
jgi:hypothetical protein